MAISDLLDLNIGALAHAVAECFGSERGARIIRHPRPSSIRPGAGVIRPGAVTSGRTRRGQFMLLPGFLLAMVAGGCAAPAVDVALVGLAPMESTLLEQRLRLDFRLQNFGQRAIQARGLDVALHVNGQQLARGVDNGPFELAGLSEARVSAVVSTSLLELARQLLTLAERDKFEYQLRGRIYLDGWPRSIAFTRSGEISRAQLERLAGFGGRSPAPLRLE